MVFVICPKAGSSKSEIRIRKRHELFIVVVADFALVVEDHSRAVFAGASRPISQSKGVRIPHAASWDELNAQLEADCRQRRGCGLHGHAETIGERFDRDRTAILPLPPTPYEACENATVRVSS